MPNDEIKLVPTYEHFVFAVLINLHLRKIQNFTHHLRSMATHNKTKYLYGGFFNQSKNIILLLLGEGGDRRFDIFRQTTKYDENHIFF